MDSRTSGIFTVCDNLHSSELDAINNNDMNNGGTNNPSTTNNETNSAENTNTNGSNTRTETLLNINNLSSSSNNSSDLISADSNLTNGVNSDSVSNNNVNNKNNDENVNRNEADKELEELAKLRCDSVATEIVAERYKRRCSDYPGLAFASSIFSSNTMMKFSVIKNELHNIMNVQLKRVSIQL